jgi:hypothetical protein
LKCCPDCPFFCLLNPQVDFSDQLNIICTNCYTIRSLNARKYFTLTLWSCLWSAWIGICLSFQSKTRLYVPFVVFQNRWTFLPWPMNMASFFFRTKQSGAGKVHWGFKRLSVQWIFDGLISYAGVMLVCLCDSIQKVFVTIFFILNCWKWSSLGFGFPFRVF